MGRECGSSTPLDTGRLGDEPCTFASSSRCYPAAPKRRTPVTTLKSGGTRPGPWIDTVRQSTAVPDGPWNSSSAGDWTPATAPEPCSFDPLRMTVLGLVCGTEPSTLRVWRDGMERGIVQYSAAGRPPLPSPPLLRRTNIGARGEGVRSPLPPPPHEHRRRGKGAFVSGRRLRRFAPPWRPRRPALHWGGGQFLFVRDGGRSGEPGLWS